MNTSIRWMLALGLCALAGCGGQDKKRDCVPTPAGTNGGQTLLTCNDAKAAVAQADVGVHSVTLNWTAPADASSFNVYMSSARNCDTRNYLSCPDGTLFVNATSPRVINGLRNGQAYFFRVESIYPDNSRVLSAEVGARPNALAFDSAVTSIAPAADGNVYLGGFFNQVGIATGSALPLDGKTGRFAIPDFPVVIGEVNASVADGKGGWYLGGVFTHVAGTPHNNLVHVLANGAVDPNFNPNVRGIVGALTVLGDKLYVGGSLTSNAAADSLLVINADGTVARTQETDGAIFTLAASANRVYVGGTFDTLGGFPRNNLAAVDASGAVDALFNPNASDAVDALAIAGDTIYAGGRFTAMAGGQQPRAHLAAVDANGQVLPWNPGTDYSVYALTTANGIIYAGGDFTRIGNTRRDYLAAIDANGALLPWNPQPDATIFTLATAGDTIYAGGVFLRVANTPRQYLAAIHNRGNLQPWDPSPGSGVSTLAASGDIVYAGGTFNFVHGTTRNYLAAVDATGALLPWNPGADSAVRAVVVATGAIFAGGDFTNAGGAARAHLAAFDPSGALLPWNPTANAAVTALAVSGSTLYAGGDFSQINGVARGRLAAIDSNGGVLGFNANVNNLVSTIAVTGDTVYAGGYFSQANNTPRSRIAAFNLDGVLLPWNPTVIAPVTSIAVSSGTVYAGSGSTLAKIDANGSLDPDFHPQIVGTVRALATAGNNIYVGGEFTGIAGTQQSYFAALNANGALLPLNPNPNRAVIALTLVGNRLYLGGSFTGLGGRSQGMLGTVGVQTGEAGL